ncbi:hypothetical protein [Frankia sp. Cas3]|uniref:hypothetical protein n=1 Tax=Frankia sp. Cas3 TaxID=3073926 RepID=UPI002AD3FCB7|nr:hypothetical protein [Frankia sp. Cas3]
MVTARHHPPSATLRSRMLGSQLGLEPPVRPADLLTCSFTTAHTTPGILQALPARHVLNCTGRADQIAEIIIETCGGDLTRRRALAAKVDARPPFSLTFGAWLGHLTTT